MLVISFLQHLTLIAPKIDQQQIFLYVTIQVIVFFHNMDRCIPHHKLQDTDISKSIPLRTVIDLPAAIRVQLIEYIPQHSVPEASQPRGIDIYRRQMYADHNLHSHQDHQEQFPALLHADPPDSHADHHCHGRAGQICLPIVSDRLKILRVIQPADPADRVSEKSSLTVLLQA